MEDNQTPGTAPEKNTTARRILTVAVAVLLLFAILFGLNLLFLPKYSKEYLAEGALIGEYYRETTDHDVLFVGDCEVYEGFIPEVLWKEYGMTAYVRGSAQQLVWQSYYIMEETFRYESPKVVVFNVLALKYGEPQKEEYNRMTLDDMRLSASKWNAIRASMTEGESFASYLFPLLRYHSRWKDLSWADVTGIFRKETVSHSGYLMQTGIKPQTSASEGLPLEDYTLPAVGFAYLDKMKALCEEHGATLILVKAPTNNWRYWWYDEWDEQVSQYAAAKGLTYLNLIPEADAMGIDWSTDTYDAGVHLNVHGAEKLTRYFGEYLSEHFSFGAHDEKTNKVWQKKYDSYLKERNREKQGRTRKNPGAEGRMNRFS